ncbi:YlqD family protein [Alkalihalobacillus sp. LMS6]|uniref:YlqD family protein n=1 Tax=Alkalihalobacillus sp. LMS6 TaxID=2924034 RepID=UPI0020D13384|nr:YlqD family protein [Alkalihalobacillus sp. LMS6]UTR04794.1 YlqD family protein [Alkalihalobacillus sp. LMS6]
MKCIRKASVKHVLTEKKRQELAQSFQEEQAQYEKEVKQLEFQLQRAQKKASAQTAPSLKERFDSEIKKRQEKLQSIQFKSEQLHHLADGTEVFVEYTDVLIDVAVGEKWVSAQAPLTIVVKDGMIHEIRESENKDT